MINIKTIGLQSHFENEYTVESNEKIGDFILNLIQQEKINEYISLELRGNKKFIGYDFLLNKKFSDYSELNQNFELFLWTALEWSRANKRLGFPLIYYKNSLSWPPAQNWNEGDGINLGPFLIWNGWGSGSTDIPNKDNNNYKNLLVLKYLNSKNEEVKKVINKYAYSIAIEKTGKDPFTNKRIEPYCLQLLASGILYKQEDKRPLLELPIKLQD
jgi:hypothetical protein